ncbi:phosphoinositide phospholipase C 2-like isoform X2 [Punica granatum]|uniref:Phosphoinositide phospholipase C n=2 Tax=Punica granatum TaxID=22663 RepID=A0A218W7E8_PUNGR|nr:phosphoinositide phospholipase C 2-like isoform X2 [Punica granatum]OWM68715.1 hypothetical protein CDL15_Pgr024902 [Punica granatum]
MSTFRVCFCFRRRFKIREAEPPQDIIDLFNQYSENGTMGIDHLHRFLLEFQREKNATKENAEAIFHSLKHLNVFHRKGGLHLNAFFRYLLSDHNPPIPPSPQVHHDMNAPLAHYYLYTGHNSYLTGNQLSSDCSSEPIKKALAKGVRVIELDLWPNATGDKVEVCHGGTLTTPVGLMKCLHATKDYAFVISDYPVVITFEDHLTPALQAKVAKMVSKTFGEMLHLPESESLAEFPSPESLKKKIMISTKPPKEYLETQDSMEETTQQEEAEEGEAEPNEDGVKAPEYKKLIAIHAGKPKGGVQSWLRTDLNKVRRLSLSEQELEAISRSHGTEIVRFTQKNLLRIYPKGARFDSSNYNPLLGWMHGAQMVALNMQGYGKYLWIMQGMFRANGGCGYIKKPDFLLNRSEIFNPGANLPVKKTLKVKLYMGDGWHLDFPHTHFDLYSPPDFFTKVGIVGVPADTTTKRSRAIEDDWVPVWNEEFHFSLTVPELAVLRIEVQEYDTSGKHDFGGQTCLPVSELREGIRAVSLFSRKGNRYKSVKLLMHFEFFDFDASM